MKLLVLISFLSTLGFAQGIDTGSDREHLFTLEGDISQPVVSLIFQERNKVPTGQVFAKVEYYEGYDWDDEKITGPLSLTVVPADNGEYAIMMGDLECGRVKRTKTFTSPFKKYAWWNHSGSYAYKLTNCKFEYDSYVVNRLSSNPYSVSDVELEVLDLYIRAK